MAHYLLVSPTLVVDPAASTDQDRNGLYDFPQSAFVLFGTVIFLLGNLHQVQQSILHGFMGLAMFMA